MTQVRPIASFRSLRSAAALGCAAILPLAGAHAQFAERLSLSGTGSVGFGTNPFLQEGSDTAAGYVELSVTPTYTHREETGEAVIQARFRATQYLNRYQSSYSYGALASGTRRLSERISIRGQADLESSIVGEVDDLPAEQSVPAPAIDVSGGLGASDLPDDLLDSIDPDLGLTGQRQRRNQLSATSGVSIRATADDELDLGVTATRQSYPNSRRAVGSTSYGATAAYSRLLSEGLTAGLTNSILRTRFKGGQGDSTVYEFQGHLSGKADPFWEFSLRAGGLVIDTEEPGRGANRSTGLAGEFLACHRGSRSNLCLSASRGARQNGLGFVAVATAVSARFNYEIDERTGVSFGGSALKTEQASGAVSDAGGRQVSLDANYRYRVRELWDISVTAGYRDVYRADLSEADFRGQVTFTARLER